MKQSTPAGGDVRRHHGSREEFWRETLRRFAASGQSVCAFCESQGVSQPSFYSWRRRLADGDAASASTPRGPSTPAFVAVHVAPENSPGRAHGLMEIALRGDRRILLSGPVDRSALVEVVSALESVQ